MSRSMDLRVDRDGDELSLDMRSLRSGDVKALAMALVRHVVEYKYIVYVDQSLCDFVSSFSKMTGVTPVYLRSTRCPSSAPVIFSVTTNTNDRSMTIEVPEQLITLLQSSNVIAIEDVVSDGFEVMAMQHALSEIGVCKYLLVSLAEVPSKSKLVNYLLLDQN